MPRFDSESWSRTNTRPTTTSWTNSRHLRGRSTPYLDPENDKFTHSFDIFLRGQEITTGGQRINNPKDLRERMRQTGIDPDDMEEYSIGIRVWRAPPRGVRHRTRAGGNASPKSARHSERDALPQRSEIAPGEGSGSVQSSPSGSGYHRIPG